MAPSPSPWPRLRDSWWVYALAGGALVLFPLSLVVEIRCGLGRCTGSFVERVLDVDAVGGLPRLYTTGLLVAAAVLGVIGALRSTHRSRWWWSMLPPIGGLLALAKLLSVHSAAKAAFPLLTLVVGVVVTVVALGTLTVTGRRWDVAATGAAVSALGVYAAAALGFDAITWSLAAAQDSVGLLTRTATTFGEELGEGLAALLVLGTLRWQLPPRSSGGRRAPAADAGVAPDQQLSTRPARG